MGRVVENYCIKNIEFCHIEKVLELVKDVFMELDASDYSQEGVDEVAVDKNLVTALAWLGNTAIIRVFARLLGAKIEK